MEFFHVKALQMFCDWDNNRVSMQGIVFNNPIFDHSVSDERFFSFVLQLERKSGYIDMVNVIFSENTIDPQKLEIGTRVKIKGTIRTADIQIEGEKKYSKIYVFPEVLFLTEEQELINDVFLKGTIVKMTPMRETATGRKVCTVILAVNYGYKSAYISCIVWGRDAFYVNSMPLYSKIVVQGRYQSRVYTKVYEDGEKQDFNLFEVSIRYLQKIKENSTN